MKEVRQETLGLCVVTAAIVWTGFRTFPYWNYRYEHPELTETQLQIAFFSALCWWDLIPLSLFVIGMILVFRANR